MILLIQVRVVVIWFIHELSQVQIYWHVQLMWMCDGFSLVVDRRRWRPNNRLQSFDYLFIYTFLTTLEANVSEEYNGYVGRHSL